MLDIGTPAPALDLPGTAPTGADHDYEISTFRLTDALETGPAIVAFYLFDIYPECMKDVCDIRDLQWIDLLESVSTFGVSTDGVFSHREFAKEYHLYYPVLSDNDGSVAEAYDVLLDEFENHRRVSQRSVFVVDTDRTVRYRWSADIPDAHPDWHAVHDATRELLSTN